jgi:hypothetical protein
MSRTAGPGRITVVTLYPDQTLDVFRIVRSNSVEDPAFVNSLRSNYELTEPPRRVEREFTVIHMGISVYTDGDSAYGTARAWPKLGDFVARLRLVHGPGFNFAHTGHRQHLTLWADPVKLSQTVVDISPVED